MQCVVLRVPVLCEVAVQSSDHREYYQDWAEHMIRRSQFMLAETDTAVVRLRLYEVWSKYSAFALHPYHQSSKQSAQASGGPSESALAFIASFTSPRPNRGHDAG
jgi:hypothetical protein